MIIRLRLTREANLLCIHEHDHDEGGVLDGPGHLVGHVDHLLLHRVEAARHQGCVQVLGESSTVESAQRYTNGQIQEFEITSALIRPSLSPVSYCLNTVVTTF